MEKELHDLVLKFLKDYCSEYIWRLPNIEEFETNFFNDYVYYHWVNIKGEEEILYSISINCYSEDDWTVIVIDYFDNLEEATIKKVYRFEEELKNVDFKKIV